MVKSGHFNEERFKIAASYCTQEIPFDFRFSFVWKRALMICLCSNVSSENSNYLPPSTVLSIPALMAPNDEMFAAERVTNFYSEYGN